MYSSGTLESMNAQHQLDGQLAAEMKIVEQAREESRKEVEALEQMKQHARAAFLSGAGATEEDFERCWPELRNQMFRQRAYHGMLLLQTLEPGE